MDCCSKYPDYRHHLIGGVGGGVNTVGAGSCIIGGGDGTSINGGSYYSHAHPSIRYHHHQHPMYRLNASGPGRFNGIGPPAPPPPPPTTPFPTAAAALTTPSLYSNYERYGSFSNLPSSYIYNGNSFSYGNLSSRDVTGYYGQYDNLHRSGGVSIGGPGGIGFSYPNYRTVHDVGLHGPHGAGGLSAPGGYHHVYAHSIAGREAYPSNFNRFHSHTLEGPYHNPSHHHYNASKESFLSQMSATIADIGSSSSSSSSSSRINNNDRNNNFNNSNTSTSNNGNHRSSSRNSSSGSDSTRKGCGNVNDENSFNSELTSMPQTNENGNSSSDGNCCSDSANGCTLSHMDYCSADTAYRGNNSVSSSRGCGPQQQQQQHQNHHNHHQQQHQYSNQPQSSPHGIEHTTGYPYGLKDSSSKHRKSTKEKDKCFARISTSNRRMECATPCLDISPKYERAETPFPPHPSNNIRSSSSSIRLQNNYLPTNGNLSQFPHSPNSWTQQCSPRTSSIRKRSYSPRPQPSPKTPLTPNTKNRVLECDFIPCKKSRKKIKNEQSDDSYEFREEIKNITPLPGFQQAFGSTEIGRFSETFLNTPESPYEQIYESEADTLSPQPWEAGDSLEGPHFNLHIGASVQPVYHENHCSMDSPIDGNYFSGIRCSNY